VGRDAKDSVAVQHKSVSHPAPEARQRRNERLKGEVTRPTKAVGILPNDEAITRLVGAILLEQNDELAAQSCRYMTLETIASLSDDALVDLPAVAV
jgi:putative transposase